MISPVLYLSHGAPPLADDAVWTRQLADWSQRLPRPESILIVSAHWEASPATVSASVAPHELYYDFWGFPQHYYSVRYDAPVAPALADRVDALLGDRRGPAAIGGVRRDENRGLDHGAYVPLVETYPQANVPVLQLSLPTLDPATLLRLGRRLAPLREEGVLIVGSGFTTHNLRWIGADTDSDSPAPSVSVEFDDWARQAVERQDVDALLDAAHAAPAFGQAHPRTEHWAPLYVSLGAALGEGSAYESSREVDGFWFGLSKGSWQFG